MHLMVCSCTTFVNCCDTIMRVMACYYNQGCHWSGRSQGNSRSGKIQEILELVREIWSFVESQGNLRKFREIFYMIHIS